MKLVDLEKEVSRIQFHTNYDRKTKNKMIVKIEKKMEKYYEL